MAGTPVPGAVRHLSEKPGKPPEQPLDTGEFHPVIRAWRLGHRLIAGTAAPVLKISPPAAEHHEPPLLLASADGNTYRIGLCHLPSIFPQRIGPCPACVSPGDRTDGQAGLVPRAGMPQDQPGYLIKIDPAFHAARMPDLHPHTTAMEPESKPCRTAVTGYRVK